MCARDPSQSASSSQSKYDITIPISLIFCWEQLNEPCGVKNLRSQFVYANPAYLKLLGLSTDFDISGLLDSEIPVPTAEFANQFQIHDRLVEREKQRKSSLEIHPYGKDRILDVFFFDKFPFFNDGGSVVGTFFHARHAKHLSMDFYINPEISGVSLVLSKPSDNFSDVEWDVTFLLLQNHTQKEIGALLFKSVGYINNIVNNIYTKCGVHNIHQFRDLSKHRGWINYVPEKFLVNRHTIINR